eukprot:gene34937-42312_t
MTTDSRKVAVRQTILDKPLIRPKTEVSLSSFAFLFSEIVQYYQNRVESIPDLEKKLETAGFGIGQRVVELVSCRDRVTRRETRIVSILQYVSQVLWKYLFNKTADNLERSMQNEDEYMIHESAPLVNTYISVPADMGALSCAAFCAGIVAGALDAARFPAQVTAHVLTEEGGAAGERTVYLIKFSPEVMSRERKLG